MASNPAGEFANLIITKLGGRSIPAESAQPTAPLGPRLPAPNLAQGSSGLAGPPPLSPAQQFGMMLASLKRPTGDGGWVEIW